MTFFLSDVRYLVNVRSCEVVAKCACGHPVAGVVVKDDFDAEAARTFFAEAYRNHLKTEGAWEHPQGHALSIEVDSPDVEVRPA